jgi:hypothetical protein
VPVSIDGPRRRLIAAPPELKLATVGPDVGQSADEAGVEVGVGPGPGFCVGPGTGEVPPPPPPPHASMENAATIAGILTERRFTVRTFYPHSKNGAVPELRKRA